MLRIGAHVSRTQIKGKKGASSSIDKHIAAHRQQIAAALEWPKAANFGAAQIFLAGPQKQEFVKSSESDEAPLAEYLTANPELYVVAHATYLDYPWSKKPYTITFIKRELAYCARTGLRGLVIHLNKATPETVAEVVPLIMDGTATHAAGGAGGAAGGASPILFLETPCLLPANAIYSAPVDLVELFVRLGNPEHVGLCIDTAHLWSSGVDLSTVEGCRAWLSAFDELRREKCVLPNNRLLLHFNDSQKALGCGKDHHGVLGSDNIWSACFQGAVVWMEWAAANDIPVILERDAASVENDYEFIKTHAKHTLA
jgi:endonuclease IV